MSGLKIVFMGTPAAAAASLSRCVEDGHSVVAVYTQPDRPSGRGQRLTPSPVKEEAARLGLAVLQPTKIRADESINTFRAHNADVAVVVAYGRILPAEYLTAFRYGAVNVHYSLLPKLRGAAPVNWAIANGDKTTGVTTMKMDEGLDTGDILLQRSTEIGADENAVELMDRLSVMGAGLLSETLASISTLEPVRQTGEATYAPIMKRSDGLIDWSMEALRISNRVRGFQPFPGSFTYFDAARLMIYASHPITIEAGGVNGEVMQISPESIVVRCGSGTALAITELQPEGKRRMAVRDYINGTNLRTGIVLGPKNDE